MRAHSLLTLPPHCHCLSHQYLQAYTGYKAVTVIHIRSGLQWYSWIKKRKLLLVEGGWGRHMDLEERQRTRGEPQQSVWDALFENRWWYEGGKEGLRLGGKRGGRQEACCCHPAAGRGSALYWIISNSQIGLHHSGGDYMLGGTVRYSWRSTLTWLRNVAQLACGEQLLNGPTFSFLFLGLDND